METWLRVSPEEFEAYIKENSLKGKRDFLHYSMYDEKGEERARFQHGFAFNEYSVKVEENEVTVRLLQGKF